MLKVQTVCLVKVRPMSNRPADYLTLARSLILAVSSFFSVVFYFFSFNTNALYLLSALTKGRQVYVGGCSYGLARAGNWKWCTAGTISTWLSSSMNNTAALVALASACGSPLSVPLPSTFLFFPPCSNPPPPSHFLLLECACLPEADSETNTCRTGRRLCHLKPCLSCCRGNQWDGGAS